MNPFGTVTRVDPDKHVSTVRRDILGQHASDNWCLYAQSAPQIRYYNGLWKQHADVLAATERQPTQKAQRHGDWSMSR